ncbi:nucleotide disphospho-sugar-binding domain-containing protein [Streptomyces sp. NPDC023838]|uniref:glycosyltransferase n=1 Tax=Streptomyces sp. NPDC023838 TaxID=3154325 RepID=UPI0033CEAFFC
MRTLLVTAGTWGDVGPYIGLGLRLQQAGHVVTLAAPARYTPAVREHGLSACDLDFDPARLRPVMDTATLRAHQSQMLKTLSNGIVSRLLHEVTRAMDEGEPVATVLSSSGTAPVVAAIAARRGIRHVCLPLQPTVAWQQAPEAGDPSSTTAMLLHHHTMRRTLTALVAHLLEDSPHSGRWETLHGFSRRVVPRPASWPDHAQICGYWWPPTTLGWKPDPALTDFLQAGPPPVYVGFGSHTALEQHRVSQAQDQIIEALRQVRLRAVIQTGVPLAGEPNDDLHLVNHVPHEWLMPRVTAAVHHAGAGTTAATLRAGIPSVPLPIMTDQPFWASRLTTLGCAPEAIPHTGLSTARLAQALQAATSEPRYRANAQRLRQLIASEDGAAAVIERITPGNCAA